MYEGAQLTLRNFLKHAYSKRDVRIQGLNEEGRKGGGGADPWERARGQSEDGDALAGQAGLHFVQIPFSKFWLSGYWA